MSTSKARQKAQNKWIAKVYDRVNLTLSKGKKELVQKYASDHGESVNGFINRLISQEMESGDDGTAASDKTGNEALLGNEGLLTPEALEMARRAAERTGETPQEFLTRAVEEMAKRDEWNLELGLIPLAKCKERGRETMERDKEVMIAPHHLADETFVVFTCQEVIKLQEEIKKATELLDKYFEWIGQL